MPSVLKKNLLVLNLSRELGEVGRKAMSVGDSNSPRVDTNDKRISLTVDLTQPINYLRGEPQMRNSPHQTGL